MQNASMKSANELVTPSAWVVSELYYPEQTSTGHFLTGIAEGLVRKLPVSVLSVQPTYAARGVRVPKFEIHNGVRIYRCPSITLDKNRIIFKLANFVSISLSIFVQAVRRFKSKDVVLVVTNPPVLPFLIVLACRLKRAKFLLLIHDVYPEVLAVTGFIKPKGFLTRLISRFSRRLYLSAARIIVLGRDMKKIVGEKMNGRTSSIVIIPNWGDVDNVFPQKRSDNSFLKKLGIVDKFVIQFSGNIGRTHNLEIIVQAAEQLRSHDRFHFLCIGWGAKRSWLERELAQRQLTNFTISDYVPREQLVTSLNACDVTIIPFISGMSGISVPSRMYNVMAAGKPIIAVADEDSELAMVIQEEDIGWVVPPGRPDKLVSIILEAQAQPEKLMAMGSRARQVVENKYSREHAIKSYLALFQKLFDNYG